MKRKEEEREKVKEELTYLMWREIMFLGSNGVSLKGVKRVWKLRRLLWRENFARNGISF